MNQKTLKKTVYPQSISYWTITQGPAVRKTDGMSTNNMGFLYSGKGKSGQLYVLTQKPPRNGRQSCRMAQDSGLRTNRCLQFSWVNVGWNRLKAEAVQVTLRWINHHRFLKWKKQRVNPSPPEIWALPGWSEPNNSCLSPLIGKIGETRKIG